MERAGRNPLTGLNPLQHSPRAFRLRKTLDSRNPLTGLNPLQPGRVPLSSP
ncbi:hypothetical protein [Thermus thermophilus HB8]|uniref:Uncharacterized protein n=1 Tax=Thermus thermophilus (strain ATCC 27634 / DSM 579 / HB8) TaxID=300852 RepID=Q5SJT8_THET8|nr:hypothetical protein [Thermus thermophilus HB8]